MISQFSNAYSDLVFATCLKTNVCNMFEDISEPRSLRSALSDFRLSQPLSLNCVRSSAHSGRLSCFSSLLPSSPLAHDRLALAAYWLAMLREFEVLRAPPRKRTRDGARWARAARGHAAEAPVEAEAAWPRELLLGCKSSRPFAVRLRAATKIPSHPGCGNKHF
jgi:hypothetical protein